MATDSIGQLIGEIREMPLHCCCFGQTDDGDTVRVVYGVWRGDQMVVSSLHFAVVSVWAVLSVDDFISMTELV